MCSIHGSANALNVFAAERSRSWRLRSSIGFAPEPSASLASPALSWAPARDTALVPPKPISFSSPSHRKMNARRLALLASTMRYSPSPSLWRRTFDFSSEPGRRPSTRLRARTLVQFRPDERPWFESDVVEPSCRAATRRESSTGELNVGAWEDPCSMQGDGPRQPSPPLPHPTARRILP